MDELEPLRDELDALDRQLLAVAARRADVVRRIARVKVRSGAALFDRDRERRIFETARRTALELGLCPELAEGLLATLVEASHRQQEETSRIASRDAGARRSFAIIGGGGGMGRLLTRELEARGHAVASVEKDDDVACAPPVREADVVLVAVPMPIAARMAEEVAPLVREDALLCDVNSLKVDVCAAFERYGRSEAVGLHPMFGPTLRSLRRQKVVVCPVRGGPMTDWLLGELGRMGLELVTTDPASHDRMMAVVQVLVHFSTLVMGEALRSSGVPIRESLRFTSPIYRLELAFVGRLFAQSPDLYAEIEMSNHYGAEMRRAYLAAARRVEETVASGDRDRFRELFRAVEAWFEGFGGEAMAVSDRIIEALVAQP